MHAAIFRVIYQVPDIKNQLKRNSLWTIHSVWNSGMKMNLFCGR